jgi:glycosyltransferase involved in cell wall biosynthesis
VVARLGIDATSIAPNGKGISRVQLGTVTALRELGRHDLVVFARPDAPVADAVRVTTNPALAWEQRGLARASREHGLDAMLTWTERLPLAGGGRYLVWLFEPPTHRIRQNRAVGAGPYQRASDLITLALWRRSLRRAELVLTGSDATARALPPVGTPVRTLYPGLDPAFTPAAEERGGGPPYVLHLGSRDPRDDTPNALAAFALARERLPEGTVLRVPGGVDGPPAPGVEYLGRVSDSELVDLYRGAAVYLDTSLYEGFGYQVLEAMACATPVVATAVTSIPELAEGVALLCPPGSPEALADELVRVMTDAGLAADLRQRGLARARQFTWRRTAESLADAVDEVTS